MNGLDMRYRQIISPALLKISQTALATESDCQPSPTILIPIDAHRPTTSAADYRASEEHPDTPKKMIFRSQSLSSSKGAEATEPSDLTGRLIRF
jgi:hypothetical protein